MSVEVLIPPYLAPQAEQPQLVDDSTSVFRPNQAPGIPQRVSFVEPRLQVRQSWKALRGAERAAMMQVIARLQGKYGTLRAAVGYTLRGSFPTSELLADPMFSNAVTNWVAESSAAVEGNDRVGRFTCPASKSGFGGYGLGSTSPGNPAIVSSGNAYVVRTCILPGKNAANHYLGAVVDAANAGSSSLCDARTVGNGGFISKAFVANVTTYVYASAICNSATLAAGDYFDVSYMSLARCAMVNSPVSAGAMMVGKLPVSTQGLLLADDLVCINGELKRVTGALDSDANGTGYLTFAPAMFRTPSSGDAVEIYQPIGQFILADNPTWTNQFGVYADLDLTFEAINQ